MPSSLSRLTFRVAAGLRPEIGLDHPRIGRHPLERTLDDLDAVVQRDDAVGDPLDDVHVVLDHEDGVAGLVAQACDQLRDLVRLDGVHARGGLVEQQGLRAGRHGPRDLEPPAVRIGQAVRRLVPAVALETLAEERQRLLCRFPDVALLAPHARGPQHRAEDPRLRAAVGSRHHVLAHRHVQEQPERLEGARDPETGDLMRQQADEVPFAEHDLARVRLVDPGDQVEQRRLPCAVRADHADDLALLDVQIELGHDLEAAERERDAAELEQLLAHQTISTRRSPSRPFGRMIMRAISIAPSTM